MKSNRIHQNVIIANQGQRFALKMNKYIQIPKLGLVKFAKSKEVQGKILSVTVRRTSSGKIFYFCFNRTRGSTYATFPLRGRDRCWIKVNSSHFQMEQKLQTLNGFAKMEERLVKVQRILSRRKYGSSNWYKQKKKVAKIHEKIVNQRNDFLHNSFNFAGERKPSHLH